jgi:RNA polymerase sigma-70 factor (ECF subfamily)
MTKQVTEDSLAAGWIKRMSEGEVAALDALYRLYHRPMLTIFAGILCDRSDAEEVLQDTFIRAYWEASRFNPQLGSPFAWLVTIGKRLSIDQLRRRRTRPKTENREQLESESDEVDAHRRVQEGVEYHWILSKLEGLPDRQRESIKMAFLDGYTHHEIAERCGRPLGTVKSDLRRGLAKLRDIYGEDHD